MTLPNFPIDKAYLIGGWLASAFWGAFTVLFAIWATSVLRSRDKSRRNYAPMAAIVLMYVLATVHISLVLARLVQGFIVHVNDIDGGGGAILYFADIGQPLNRSKDMIYVSMIVLADLILIWRCFMVWNRNYYVIALPAIMVLGTAISGYGAVGRYFTPDPFTDTSVKWAEAMLSVSMATNLLVTGLTAGRIWGLSRNLAAMSFQSSQVKYRSIILIIVESGVFMAVSKTIEFVLFELSPNDGLNGLNAFYIPLDCMPQIMGIFPCFIMLAVSQGLTSSGTSAYTAGENRYGSKGGSSSGYSGSAGRQHVFPPIAFAKPSDTQLNSTTTTGDGTYGKDSFQLKESDKERL